MCILSNTLKGVYTKLFQWPLDDLLKMLIYTIGRWRTDISLKQLLKKAPGGEKMHAVAKPTTRWLVL